MGWGEHQDRLQTAVFARLGLDARWNDSAEPVRVVLRDEDTSFGRAVVDQVSIRVRRSDIAEPAKGDVVEIVDDERRFEVIAEPLLDRKGTWRCEAAPRD